MLNTMITLTVNSHTLVPERKSQNNENKFYEMNFLGSSYLNGCKAEIVDFICILIMIIFIMSIAKRQKQIIGKEEYIVFQSTDFSLDQYYNFISQSYAVIV